MRKIYTIGETIYDIIFENDIPIASKAGGSMLNTSVSLGTLGLPVTFISEIGNDVIGNSICDFLLMNNVSTKAIELYKGFPTPLALAFLDENKKANYTFYRIYPKKRLINILPKPAKGDIVLYGSIYSITPEIYEKLYNFLLDAKNNGSLLIYDPNFRKPEQGLNKEILNMIEKNISLASVVKGSDEDFLNIYNVSNIDDAYKIILKMGCHHLIYTRGAEGVDIISNNLKKHYITPKINPISTIGAGDTFNSGIIYSFVKLKITNKTLEITRENEWDIIINNAIIFATFVCMSYDNFLKKELISEFV